MDSTRRPDRLPALTGSRFVAALAVSLLHFSAVGLPAGWASDALAYLTLMPGAVSYFFILSGFILAYNYADRLAVPSRAGWWAFLVARFARIYPVYLASLLAAAVLLPPLLNEYRCRRVATQWKLVTQVTMTQSLVPSSEWYYWGNAPAWSISTEWCVYLAFPALLAGLCRLPTRALPAAGVGMALVALGWSVWLRDSHRAEWLAYVFPVTRVPDFAAGATLGLWAARRPPGGPPLVTARGAALEAAAVGLLAAAFVLGRDLPFSLRWSGYFSLPALLMVAALAAQRGPLAWLLARPAAVWLGEVSFAYYLFHVLVLQAWLQARPSAGVLPWYAQAGGLFLATLALAAALHCWYETPARRLISRLAGRPKSPPAG